MKELQYEGVVIGGGAAGMAAALELIKNGVSCAIIEREPHLGGILTQCIHNGFGLIEFNEELSGPEFAEKFEEQVKAQNITCFLSTTVMEIQNAEGKKILYCYSSEWGILKITCDVLILAMGCRERNRGNIRIPGDRPAGVYTAGLAQRLVNIEGYIPGKDIVIIGSGDIGLIMARRMSWVGCKVHAVVEILPYPSGITRNIVQCLHDFNIPLYLSHLTTRIIGKDRVEAVEITPLENGALITEKAFTIPCDTVLLSVGLVPENELSKMAGVELHPMTNGPVVNSMLMTSVPGVFACGNVLHVHDLVDYVVEESRRAGANAAQWIKGRKPGHEVRVKAGPNIRYTAPMKVDAAANNKLYMRPLIVKNSAVLEVKINNQVVKTVKKNHVQPSEMIMLDLTPADLDAALHAPDPVVEIALQ